MLIIPSQRRLLTGSRWSSIGGLGEITDFEYGEIAEYTTVDQYVRETSNAVRSVADYGAAGLREYMSPPTITSTSSLRAGIESVAGASLTDIIMGAIAPDLPPMIRNMLVDWLDYAIDMAIEQVATAVADVVGEVVSVVPMLGEFLKRVVQGIIDTVKYQHETSPEEFEKKSLEMLADQLNNKCPAWLQIGRPAVGTSVDGKSVADYFRPVAYRAYKNMPLPMSPMSLFIMLCGAESQGVGFANRQQYDAFLSSAKNQLNDPGLGLPRHQQRQMWEIIRGIMSSVQDPAIEALSYGDHGRSLFPLLQDMVWQTNKDVIPLAFGQGKPATNGYWTWEFLELLSDRLCGETGQWKTIGSWTDCATYTKPGVATAIEVCGSCASRVTPGLVLSFHDMQKQWSLQMTAAKHAFWVGDAYTGHWTSMPAVQLQPVPARGFLMLDKDAIMQAVGDSAEAYGYGRPRWRKVMDPVMTGLGSVAGAYLAWSAVRKIGGR